MILIETAYADLLPEKDPEGDDWGLFIMLFIIPLAVGIGTLIYYKFIKKKK